MRHSSLLLLVALLCAITACQPQVDHDSHVPTQDTLEVAQTAPITLEQAATDQTGDNYIVLGGPYIDLLGEDGEPDQAAGRLVNGGTGVTTGSANENVWLLLGPTGKLTYLDEEGRPLRGDLLEVLDGNGVLCSTLGERLVQTGATQSTWLVGGEQGRVQLVNKDGEPETTLKNQVFADGSSVVAAGYSKAAEQWLVGNPEGELAGLGAMLEVVTVDKATFAGIEISGIIGNPAPNAAPNERWVVAGGDRISYFPGHTPLTFAGETFTSLAQADGKIVAGTASGRVAMWSFEALDVAPTWVDALEGKAVNEMFWNGSDWLVLGEQGAARLISGAGALKDSIKTLGDGSTLVSARWVTDGWLIATTSSLVLETNAELELLVDYVEPLGGATLYDSAPGKDIIVTVGDQGKYAVLDKFGVPIGTPNTLAGTTSLTSASWSGTTFLIGGTGGRAQLLDEQGVAMGEPMTLLGGKDISAIAWSGNFWLVAGAGGTLQRVRPDGEPLAGVTTLAGFEQIHAARWSGDEWLVGGTNQGVGTAHRVKSDASSLGNLITLNSIASLHAVEWNGREWIVGGTGGLVQIISASGEPRTQPGPQPRDVLSGGTVYSIDFHDNTYLIAGENGLTSLLNQSLQTSAPPIAAAGFETIHDARWTLARGYGRGECLTNEACYAGKCIGDLQGGFCCDRACDRACESCLSSKTGGTDGLCTPLPADSEPIISGACETEDASTCGQTGMCDGAGECALHGSDVVCEDASCTTGNVTPESLCDGAGTCVAPTSVACAPYLTCEGAGCGTTCTDDTNCAEGYECIQGSCEVKVEEMIVPEPEPAPEEGCCAVVAPREGMPSSLGLLGLCGLFLLRRRRRS